MVDTKALSSSSTTLGSCSNAVKSSTSPGCSRGWSTEDRATSSVSSRFISASSTEVVVQDKNRTKNSY